MPNRLFTLYVTVSFKKNKYNYLNVLHTPTRIVDIKRYRIDFIKNFDKGLFK